MKKCVVKGPGFPTITEFDADSCSVQDDYLHLMKTEFFGYEETHQEGPFWNRHVYTVKRLSEYKKLVAIFAPDSWDYCQIIEKPEGE